MQLSPILTKARALRNLYYVRNYKAASLMANCGVDRHSVIYDKRRNSYYVRELNLRIDPPMHALLSVLWQAMELKRAGVTFSNVGQEIVAHTPEFLGAVENQDELFILMEIIARGVYSLVMPSNGAVVLDVGMNVGFASLHFAAQSWVKEVWAYEPVPQTYARAERNLQRNPSLALKIKPHNLGLSDKSGEMEMDFCSQWRGAAGLLGLSPEFRRYHEVKAEEINKIKVQVCGVAEVLRKVRLAHPGSCLIMKLDTEGAEYSILGELEREGLMHGIDCFLIEWHQRGPLELERMLTNAGFSLFSFKNSTTGMIYACKGRMTTGASRI